MVTATQVTSGVGLTEGEGVILGDADGLGVTLGLGLGVGVTEGVGLGDGVLEGEGLGVTLGVGVLPCGQSTSPCNNRSSSCPLTAEPPSQK